MVVIGYEQSEQLDVEPAQYFVRILKREKRACKACEGRGVTCAPLPERIIEKGLASDRVVIDTGWCANTRIFCPFIARA
jgi:transposase